jgi:DNA-binding FrmR family transcriptional regulator
MLRTVDMSTANHASHREQLTRLRRIEGQVKAIGRMVDEERYCVELLTQLRAVRSAVKRVEERILREHVEHCVVEAIRGGKRSDATAKLEELLEVLARFSA